VANFYRGRFISIIDLTLLVSYFHIFLRPILNSYCNVGQIYTHHNDFYNEMTIFGGVFIVMFQLGMLLSARHPKVVAIDKSFSDVVLWPMLQRFSIISSAIVFLLLLFCFYLYGASFLPWFRDPGRWTQHYPFAGISFYLAKVIAYYAIPSLCALIAFCKNSKSSIVLLIFLFFALIAFGKRGAIIAPLLLSVFAVSYLTASGYDLVRKVNLLFLGLLLLAIFGALFSRTGIFSGGFDICTLNNIGQDYDLIWPLVYNFGEQNSWSIMLAFEGIYNTLLYSFDQRMANQSYNITDLLMMSSNLENYSENGFGVTPYFSQFYFILFGFSSLVVAFLIGVLCKRAELKAGLSLANGRLIGMVFYIFVIHFFMSAWDYKIKVLLLELFFVWVLVYFARFKLVFLR